MTTGRLQKSERKMVFAERRMPTLKVSERRIAGMTNQKRRLRLWSRDPHCAGCGCLVDYPGGFELDHIIPLSHGGPDIDDNCQVLCVYMTTDMRKAGCHHKKTLEDIKK